MPEKATPRQSSHTSASPITPTKLRGTPPVELHHQEFKDLTPLQADFFVRDSREVAQELLGALLVYQPDPKQRAVGLIVETEAYREDDPACHAWGHVDKASGKIRPEGRSAGLFAAPGMAYIYLNYGVHWLLNVVTEPKDTAGAVLIRAVEPLYGLSAMQLRRPKARRYRDLTNGPGKLTQAMGIDPTLHQQDLTRPPLYFAKAPQRLRPQTDIASSARIGISRGIDRPWRYFFANHPYVSPAKPPTP